MAAIGMRALANAKLRECTKIRCGSFFVAMSTRSVIDPASAISIRDPCAPSFVRTRHTRRPGRKRVLDPTLGLACGTPLKTLFNN